MEEAGVDQSINVDKKIQNNESAIEKTQHKFQHISYVTMKVNRKKALDKQETIAYEKHARENAVHKEPVKSDKSPPIAKAPVGSIKKPDHKVKKQLKCTKGHSSRSTFRFVQDVMLYHVNAGKCKGHRMKPMDIL